MFVAVPGVILEQNDRGAVMADIQIDEAKVEEFVGQVVVEAGAALSALLVYAGDQLGLYQAMAHTGPLTSTQLAEITGTHERMVREWLANQAAGGYVAYEPEEGMFSLPVEHALALTTDETLASVAGLFQLVAAAYRDADKLIGAFRTGQAFGWTDHDPELFRAIERSTRPDYENNLVAQWIPTLGEGVVRKLETGARIADIGCGHGMSTVIMAKAYPNSEFIGFDKHRPSIERARKLAADEGVSERATFEIADAKDFAGEPFDLICYLDSLHDMGDPLGALRHAKGALASDGAVLLVEIIAGDRLEENFNPIGRLAYALSTVICVPHALSEGGAALGAQAGEARMHALFKEAGFTHFRRASETPFNAVYEARL
jgi:SAM-dependent methyltransferase